MSYYDVYQSAQQHDAIMQLDTRHNNDALAIMACIKSNNTMRSSRLFQEYSVHPLAIQPPRSQFACIPKEDILLPEKFF